MLSKTPQNPYDVDTFQQICHQRGGYLVEINSEEEYTHVLNFVKRSLPNGRQVALTGATDRDQEEKWVYLRSGSPVTYFRWYSHTRWDQYNCIRLIWNDFDEGMHDWKCAGNDGPAYILCERNNISKHRSKHVTISILYNSILRIV